LRKGGNLGEPSGVRGGRTKTKKLRDTGKERGKSKSKEDPGKRLV